MKRILVIAPHPDDDLIGCGGSIAKHLKNGHEVNVVYITNGDAENLKYSQQEFTNLRKQETLNAAKVMGLSSENLIFLDESVWDINENSTRRKILELIREIKPEVCYIPHQEDKHVDHKIVFRIALDAISMAPSPWFKKFGKNEDSWKVYWVFCYEVWTPLKEFLYVEDITQFIDKKSKALLKHKSQIFHTKYHLGIKGLNQYRGIMTGKGKYCECFQVVKIKNY